MEFLFKDTAENDLIFFQNNTKILKRIELLLTDIKRNPLSGIGKPEPLKEKVYMPKIVGRT